VSVLLLCLLLNSSQWDFNKWTHETPMYRRSLNIAIYRYNLELHLSRTLVAYKNRDIL